MDARNFIAQGIYKWVFPNGKCYIGRACNFKDRYSDYVREVKDIKYNRFVIRALRKYKIENCKFIAIELTEKYTDEDINLRESLWIKFYKSTNSNFGYNITAHSTNQSGLKHSPEAKNKIRIAREKQDMSWRKGIPRDQKTIEKISQSKTGKNNLLKRIPIKQIDKNTNEVIKLWNSVIEAIQSLNLPKKAAAAIRSCCNNNHVECSYGFKWEYVNKPKISVENKRIKYYQSLSKPIIQLDLNGNFIKEWNSISEAGKTFSQHGRQNILWVLRGKNKKAFGFYWKYKNSEVLSGG